MPEAVQGPADRAPATFRPASSPTKIPAVGAKPCPGRVKATTSVYKSYVLRYLAPRQPASNGPWVFWTTIPFTPGLNIASCEIGIPDMSPQLQYRILPVR